MDIENKPRWPDETHLAGFSVRPAGMTEQEWIDYMDEVDDGPSIWTDVDQAERDSDDHQED